MSGPSSVPVNSWLRFIILLCTMAVFGVLLEVSLNITPITYKFINIVL